ncbi:MAG: hypothetical protein C4518_05070 [Desulfobacteraceae bacterium]|nr:MAG: hypothetical protein C4518_05070 [Desulfobacteraceae bacterium]
MMNTRAILDDAIKMIRAIPANLSGDDSPLADAWEEIKDQVQHERSFLWQAYLDTMDAIIEGTADSLSKEDRMIVAAELKLPPEDPQRLRQVIMKRLIARAKREKIRYVPFDFTHFRYSIADMTVYAKIIVRTGLYKCEIVAYSGAAPFGEKGEVSTNIIEDTMSSEEFDRAQQQGWPDKREEPESTLYDEVAREAAISLDEARRASEALLKALHRRLVEYRGINGDYLGEMAHWELSEKGFYHLLGFVEEFSIRYSWEKNSISEYLGRLPPVERWKALAKEIRGWNWRDE